MIAPIRSILLLHSGALGDTLLHLRLAQAFKLALGEAAVTWLGRDGWLPVARRCKYLDRLVGMDAMKAHRLFAAGEQTDADLAEWLGSFDLIFNGMASTDSPVALRLRRFARRAAITYDTSPQKGSDRHIVGQWIDQIVARTSGVLPDLSAFIQSVAEPLLREPDTLLRPEPDDLAEAALLLRSAGIDKTDRSRVVLVHPGSGGRHKCWPIENYTRLTEILEGYGFQTVMILGPVEMEQLGETVGVLRRGHHVIANPSLTALIGLAGSATAYVGNDAGPTHLAAAAGTATIALFGPTDPQIWQPVGPRVAVMQSQAYDANWADLSPEFVAAALRDIL